MKLRELAAVASGSTPIKVYGGGDTKHEVALFNANLYGGLACEVLGLEIKSISVPTQAEKENGIKPRLLVFVNDDRKETAHVFNTEQLQEVINAGTYNKIILEKDMLPVAGKPFTLEMDTGGSVTVDLRGHHIYAHCNQEDMTTAAIKVTNGDLSIIGDGRVSGGKGCMDNVAAWASGKEASLWILGGFYDVGTDFEGAANNTIYANEGGLINISGGFFRNTGVDILRKSGKENIYPFVLNTNNDDSGSSIICDGGIFAWQNPADGDDSGSPESYLAEKHEVWTMTDARQEPIYQVLTEAEII